MKKILPVLTALFLNFLLVQVMAQSYVPITVTSGFNADLIANGNSTSAATTYIPSGYGFDEGNEVFFGSDFVSTYTGTPPCSGIPHTVNSASGPVYSIPSFATNNCLLMKNTGDGGTLVFNVSGTTYEKLSLLAASARHPLTSAIFDATVNFSDGSSYTTTFAAPDWTDPVSPYSIALTPQSCKVNLVTGPDHYSPSCNVKLYDCMIDLTSYPTKVVTSIYCHKTSLNDQNCAVFAVCGITAATAPLAVIADAATSIGTFNFDANWHPAPGDPHPPTSYRLDVSTDPGFGSFVTGYNNLNVGSVVTLPVTGLSALTTYYYRVRGVNSDGVGPSSNVITVTTLNNVPRAIIADPATDVLGTTFDANWHPDPTDPYPPTSYRLDVATTSTFNAGTFVTGYNDLNVGSAVTWPVTGLNVSSTYYYRVRGVNVYGTGPSSNVITVNTTDGLPPAPVATPATAVIQIKFWAHWNAGTPTPSEAVDCYYLDVATTPTFNPGTFVGIYNNLNVGLNTMCLITGTTPGTTYYYRVRAHNIWGLSIDSNVITVITVPSNIPTLSEWGLIILGLVLLGAGTLYITKWHS